MNNYKFRGKTAAERWEYGSLLKNSDGKCAIVDEDNTVNFNYLSYAAVRPETVGQWTGQKDIKNNDLYEGDILKVAGCLLVVKFEPCFFNSENTFSSVGFYLKKVKTRYGETMQWDKQAYYEVIGNIHDNPEILEDK